jgi:adenylylsulfate kinase-like enzyme
MIYYFCGQPASGKTTLAKRLLNYLDNNAFHIDGDNLRELLQNKDYSEEGRKRNCQSVNDIARYLASYRFDVVISVVSPYREIRESLKKTNSVIEFYVHTENIRGREKFFVDNFEKPESNFVDVCTDDASIEETFNNLINHICGIK